MCRPMVVAMARQTFGSIPDMRVEDLEQEFYEVLFLACLKYDPNKGAKFTTFFRDLIRNRIGHLRQYAFAQKRQSNLWVETLSDEAVAWAVEEATAAASAEEDVMALITVREVAAVEAAKEERKRHRLDRAS